MDRFTWPASKQFASSPCLAPGNKISAGRRPCTTRAQVSPSAGAPVAAYPPGGSEEFRSRIKIFRNIQALRAVAALLVVIGHSGAFGLVAPGPLNIHLVAYSGVDIFFVISGFIISTVATRHEANSWIFLAKRAGRIFPVYWIVLAVSVVASRWIVVGDPWVPKMPHLPATDYLFLLTLANRFAPQAWSMAYEIYFYAWIGLILLVSPRRLWVVLGILMLCQVGIVTHVALAGRDPDAAVYTSSMVLQFGLGCAVAWACDRGLHRFAMPALVLGFAGFVAGAAWTAQSGLLPGLPRTVTFGLGSAALLYALVSYEVAERFILPRFMHALGNISYSIYLWHMLILTIFYRLLPREAFATSWSRNIFGAVCVLTIIGVSFLSYHVVEAPGIRTVNHWLSRLRTARDGREDIPQVRASWP
jgi:exopolysaccharide production protein ExoZ